MRKDMDKVIVERPRLHRAGEKYARRQKREQSYRTDPDSAPAKEPLRARDRRTKTLNENLKPLVRFLAKQVGRPWDKVRSEIRTVISAQNTVQAHVLDHVKDVVFEHVTMVDGIPYQSSMRGLRPIAANRHASLPALYACPKSGILKRARMPREKPPKPIRVKRIDAGRVAVHLKGCWHEAEMVRYADVVEEAGLAFKDAVLGVVSDYKVLEAFYGLVKGHVQCAVSLRPMTRAEIRMLP